MKGEGKEEKGERGKEVEKSWRGLFFKFVYFINLVCFYVFIFCSFYTLDKPFFIQTHWVSGIILQHWNAA